jgi:hypothetical protein
LENQYVMCVQQVTFAQIPLLLHSSVKLEHIQQQDQLHAHLVMMVISVNSKNKLQILSINFALQDSIVSMILEMILNLNRSLALLVSISH